MSDDDKDTNKTTADDMGGATGITGGGESGGPGEGVQGEHPDPEDRGATQGAGAGAANLNAGQPSIGQDDQPEADAGRSDSVGRD